jgi:hypothetical protein
MIKDVLERAEEMLKHVVDDVSVRETGMIGNLRVNVYRMYDWMIRIELVETKRQRLDAEYLKSERR